MNESNFEQHCELNCIKENLLHFSTSNLQRINSFAYFVSFTLNQTTNYWSKSEENHELKLHGLEIFPVLYIQTKAHEGWKWTLYLIPKKEPLFPFNDSPIIYYSSREISSKAIKLYCMLDNESMHFVCTLNLQRKSMNAYIPTIWDLEHMVNCLLSHWKTFHSCTR